MAVDSYDSTTGRPIFSDSGAPDIAVDPTEVGKYAADVGNRIVRANLSALNSYGYKRAGLTGHALDTKTDYVHDGTGWVATVADTGWVALPFGGTWANLGGGYKVAQYRRKNGVVYVDGVVKDGAIGPGQLIATLPVGFRPAAYIMRTVWANGAARSVEIAPDGRIVVGDTSVSNLRTSLGFSFVAEQ